jgi:hypothetical protein
MDAFEAIRKERTSGKVLCGTTKAAKSELADEEASVVRLLRHHLSNASQNGK